MIKSFYSVIFFILFSFSLHGFEPASPFVIVAPERAGTHLLTKTISKILEKSVHNLWSHSLSKTDLEYALSYADSTDSILQIRNYPNYHTLYTLKELGYKVLFLIRDPRDQLISALFFIRDKHWEYQSFDCRLPFGGLSFDEQLSEAISGERYNVSLVEEISKNFLPWLDQPEDFVHKVCFEHLVGEKGEGSRETQINEIEGICQFLNIHRSDQQIESVAEELFGKKGEGTFRSGKIGKWKNYFNEKHKEEFKKVLGNELIDLGYTQDFNW